jgi:hypothetical protein
MSPSDRPCRQAHIRRIETLADIFTDHRVVTWDTTRARSWWRDALSWRGRWTVSRWLESRSKITDGLGDLESLEDLRKWHHSGQSSAHRYCSNRRRPQGDGLMPTRRLHLFAAFWWILLHMSWV